jgi:hypothetical protein
MVYEDEISGHGGQNTNSGDAFLRKIHFMLEVEYVFRRAVVENSEPFAPESTCYNSACFFFFLLGLFLNTNFHFWVFCRKHIAIYRQQHRQGNNNNTQTTKTKEKRRTRKYPTTSRQDNSFLYYFALSLLLLLYLPGRQQVLMGTV